jgi:hypothetical protein
MPLKSYDQQQPDPSPDAPLWRFMPLSFFQDFMANEELYLRRCDLYTKNDPQDGIPTDDFVRKQLGLQRYRIEDELALISHQGSNRLFTEIYYLSCWSLYNKEHEMQMWQQYAKDGVAIQTTFGQMQAAVRQFPDEMHMGAVRYGDEDMTRYNLLQFMFTKGTKFRWETEVRIAMCSPDPKGGQARNYDENNVAHREALDHLYPRHPWVFDYKRRRLLLKCIITGIAISPWAPETVVNEVKHDWASIGDLKLPIHHVSSSLIPSPEDLAIHGGIGHLPQKPAAVAP